MEKKVIFCPKILFKKQYLFLSITIFIFHTNCLGQESNKLGNVVYSVLTPELFREQNGNGWFLLDGGIDLEANGIKPSETDLCSIAGNFCNEIPDARGVFIRGMNIDRNKAFGDVDNTRIVGSLQLDSIGEHSHRFEGAVAIAMDKKNQNDRGGNVQGPENNRWSFETLSTGKDIIKETRPKNITLYTYIKLNKR